MDWMSSLKGMRAESVEPAYGPARAWPNRHREMVKSNRKIGDILKLLQGEKPGLVRSCDDVDFVSSAPKKKSGNSLSIYRKLEYFVTH
jgi:hypothetical protein